MLKLIVFLIFATSAHAQIKTNLEIDSYFKTRDRYVAQMKKKCIASEDTKLLKELELKLRKILNEPNGRIHLETLCPDSDFGYTDGVDVKNFFITSKELLRNRKAADAHFFQKTFSNDAALTFVANLPIEKKKFDSATALLMIQAQDVGPLEPNVIGIYAEQGNKIFAQLIEIAAPQISVCKEGWDKAIAAHPKLEDKAFKDYAACYGKNIKNEIAFTEIVKRAQSSLTN